MTATPRRDRRSKIMQMLRSREPIDAVTVDSLAEKHQVKRGVIMRDLEVVRRRIERNASEPKGLLADRLRQLSRTAEAAGFIGDAIRAEVALANLTGNMPKADSVTVNANASAQATTTVNTFAELARKAEQEEARNRVGGMLPEAH